MSHRCPAEPQFYHLKNGSLSTSWHVLNTQRTHEPMGKGLLVWRGGCFPLRRKAKLQGLVE
jgi:hypothetical protein